MSNAAGETEHAGSGIAEPRTMESRVRSTVQATILLLFGAALLKLASSDALLRYVRPVARPWVALAGTALVLLAGWTLLSLLRQPAASASVGDELGDRPGDGHGHGPVTPAMWLVLAPVVAVLVVAPPALGAFTAQRAPAVRAAAGRAPALTASSQPVTVSMFGFLILSDARPAALRDQQVTLTGFVLSGHAGGFTLARLVITCCAADASTARVDVGYSGSIPASSSWVRVTGTFAGTDSDPDRTPRLTARSLIPIPQPANPYDH